MKKTAHRLPWAAQFEDAPAVSSGRVREDVPASRCWVAAEVRAAIQDGVLALAVVEAQDATQDEAPVPELAVAEAQVAIQDAAPVSERALIEAQDAIPASQDATVWSAATLSQDDSSVLSDELA